ncbi:hypothetical protein SEA_PHONEGINGI_9 [Microbacterium phage Phonegingi]|nr:hypothetical protein SEA_PHONEGINGI_9 [Microbacterium phage Phonegingi]
MRVGGTRYDVRMIETFEDARIAVRREMSLLAADPDDVMVSDLGYEDEHGWFVPWGVRMAQQPVEGQTHYANPLPRAATFVDRLTGFVSMTNLEAEHDRISNMRAVRVE